MSQPTTQRNLVFCHRCENEWYEHENGLICPACESDFTEIIEPGLDPRQDDTRSSGLHTHDPWASAPDPDEDDIEDYSWSSSGPPNIGFSGFYHNTTGSHSTSPQPGAFPVPLFQNFSELLRNIAGSAMQSPSPAAGGFDQQPPFRPQSAPGSRTESTDQRRATGMPRVEIRTTSGPNFRFTTHTTTVGGDSGDGQSGQIPDEIQHMISTLFAGPGNMRGQEFEQRGIPFNPMSSILQSLFMPGNAVAGDAVYSQEAMDRVISQLMEQNASGNAPGPASSAAIAALPKKLVEASMLDEQGKAECSICMDNVTLGDEVSTLPCSHWFHPPCIAAWLREHDTCPHCRAGITPRDGSRNAVRTPSEAPLNNEDPFELVRRQSGTREHPYVVTESPSRERRQPGYRRQSSSTMEPNGSGGQRNQQQGPPEGGNGGGGITGSLRSWFGGSAGGASPGGQRR